MIAGIFGGTFDPPHAGHLGAARTALASREVDEVWWVPCLEHRFGKRPAPFEDRLEMCRLAVAGEPGMRVSDIERSIRRPGHTLDLVRELRRAHPGVELRLVAGADIFHERDKWHRYDEIARLAPPLYVAREGAPPVEGAVLPPPPGVVATAVREALERGERPRDAVPRAVLEYIEARGLYRGAP